MRLFKRIFLLSVAALLAACCPLLSGCGIADEEIRENISELRENIWRGESEKMEVFVISGIRENPFIIDGKSEPKQDFLVMAINPRGGLSMGASFQYNYTVKFENKEYSGKFLLHPFGQSYEADAKARIPEGADIEVTISADGYSETFALSPERHGDMIGWEEAVTIAKNKIGSGLNELKNEDGKLYCDVYIRFIDNPVTDDGTYFWYVAFAGSDGLTKAVLIDPRTKEILAER